MYSAREAILVDRTLFHPAVSILKFATPSELHPWKAQIVQ